MSLFDGMRLVALRSTPRYADQALVTALTAAHPELLAAGGVLLGLWQRLPGDPRVHVYFGGRPAFPAARPDDRLLYPPGATAAPADPPAMPFTTWVRCTVRTDVPVDPVGGFDEHVAHSGDPFSWLTVARPLTAAAVADELADLDMRIPPLRRDVRLESSRTALRHAEHRYQELTIAQVTGAWAVEVFVAGPTPLDARRTAAALCASADLPYRLIPDGSAPPTGPTTTAPGLAPSGPFLAGHDRTGPTATGPIATGPAVTRPVETGPAVTRPVETGPAVGDSAAAGPLMTDSAAPGPVAGEPVVSGAGVGGPPVSGALVAGLIRPPRRELPGVRLVDHADFDLTPETSGDLVLGDVLDDTDRPVGTFSFPTATLNRHAFVAGATGAGKSQTIRHLLERLHHAGIPWLVVEPAKAEYAAMAGRIGAVTVIRPGDPDAVPVGLNPLEPEPGFPLQTHLDQVRALFLAAFDAHEPFPQVLSHALFRAHTDLGWDPVTGTSRLPGVTPRRPTLADLRRAALEVVRDIGYGREVTDNVRGFVDVRLSALSLGTCGRFLDGGHPLDVADLLARPVVLELEDVGDDQDKAFFIGAVLLRLHQHLRTRRGTGSGLRHVTVVEEAHRLLRRAEPGSPGAHAVELFTALLAEIRAYGEGVVVAEQIPAKIVPDVVKNTALKIVHRLPAADDRAAVGATMNLDEAQSRHVVSLPPGRAVVFADGMDRPVRVAVPLGEDRERTGRGPDVALRSRRTAACGPLCAARPCLSREVNAAGLLAGEPRVVLWIELLTIAHLVGRPAPRPWRSWLASLRGDRRTVECAVAHRVGHAVDVRYRGLAAHYRPESLAAHLTASALSTVDSRSTGCDGTEVTWQAGRHRWADVAAALRTFEGDGPHPDTAAWSARGLTLTGRNAAEQAAELRDHPDSWQPDESVVTGDRAYAAAVDRLSRATPLRARFLAATAFLDLGTTWPLAVLPDPGVVP
ncbi:hypothetical protein GCM10022243_29900 [Saccharothrix violaceirubra]|uniref:Helicase HerA-like C-terminal domain-containing protein n=1 Tax=Saccharothrix violaceirubra TaxID=413306 RepID=A0A7W7T4T9_9PSEU|nr:ATP-binding protein [Saccharothrix violaceirubra]MBB4966614.1 hypothetical protein [Saccharothrix violaceirubra]